MSELESQQPELFRRRRFEAPHRRRHPLRRLFRPFVSALAAVGIPAALGWWVLTSPAFEIRRIEVVASERVEAGWVGERLDELSGRHLLGVRLSEVEARLSEHPWIADLALRRELPGRLEVTVLERRPAALWREGEALLILDSAGRRIAPLDGGSGALDLPVISALEPSADPGAAASAIAVAERWQRLRPADLVSEVEILPAGDFRLITTELPFTVVVSADRLEAAPGALARALPALDRYPASLGRLAAVDLRFSRQIVFQPAAEPPREEG